MINLTSPNEDSTMKTMLKIVQKNHLETKSLFRPATAPGKRMSQTRAPGKLPALFLVATKPVPAAELEIRVTNVTSSKGQIRLAIYDKEANFSKTMKIGTAQPAVAGEVLFNFPKLPVGNYAVMVFQDINNNGKFDTDSLGIPKEPWGGSLQGKTVFGTPKWSDAQFELPQDGLSLTIPLQGPTC